MNSEKHLHIISFDNPYPADYGGVIDVFYKLRQLHALGFRITLHAFEYGRPPHKDLEKYCEQVYYYKRKKFTNPLKGLPYIVATRRSDLLLKRLLSDDHPILFEGLHTCFYLDHPALDKRKKLVRMHNIEHEYYRNLMDVETNPWKKIFFSQEAKRLLKFEQALKSASHVLAISPNDKACLSERFGNVTYIPAFHSNNEITSLPGKGGYAFYHGKLSVGENDEAAKFLVREVFSKTDKLLYIAGNNPSEELVKAVQGMKNVKLFDNLNTEQISQMMKDAQVNIVPTFQATGIKLKLINVLFQGRFVLANNFMVRNTGCEQLCAIADTAGEFTIKLDELFAGTFTEDMLLKRAGVLKTLFNNEKNAETLASLINI